MTQAALGVEIVGEIIRKDGRRIPVTDKAIPEHIKFLIGFILNERVEDLISSTYSYEEMMQTIYRIFNLK